MVAAEQLINDVPITGPIIKAKAEIIAEKLGISEFKVSDGWLGKFKQRHNISIKGAALISLQLQEG